VTTPRSRFIISTPRRVPIRAYSRSTTSACSNRPRPRRIEAAPRTNRPDSEMQITVATWNINSVRLRFRQVAKFINAFRPDVLCLQETKCPDQKFPLKRFTRLGYEHAALNGQKGYHGVAVLSRLPFEQTNFQDFCGRSDCRHVAVVLGERAGLRDPVTV